MERLNFKLPERQREDLKDTALQAGVSVSEVLRRMIDHCSQEGQLNLILPSMSGAFVNRGTS